MKRVFILALSVASLVACKKNVEPTIDNGKNEKSDVMISLSSLAPASRAANEGVREDLFETGDQIGVIAVHSDDAAGPTPPEAPNWAEAVYFDNKPAMFTAEKVEEPALNPKVSLFEWGATGEGGLVANQYYPAKKGKIFLFAYYPYSTTNYVAPDGASSTPMLNIELSDGTIAGVTVEAENAEVDANLRQADVMYYGAAASISSIAPNATPLAFQHGLAQLNFMVKLAAGASPCKLTKIEFKTVKTGVMDITTGGFTYETTTTDYEKAAVYTITPKTVISIPKDSEPAYNILAENEGTPLMIFPLDAATIQKGELIVTCDFSATSTPDEKELNVSLASVTNSFVQGKLNVFNISVSLSMIKLEATIAPWDPAGSIETLPAE